jgi:DNA-binding HxlR family transcriptional regulator
MLPETDTFPWQPDDIDKTIHEPGRLMILLNLYIVSEADFVFLMKQTKLSKGNLSSHLSKLEEAGFIKVTKEFVEKKPRTLMALTPSGRTAFDVYKQTILTLLQ